MPLFIDDMPRVVTVPPCLRLASEPMREPASNMLHRFRKIRRCDQQMNVVGHHDERMKPVESLSSIMLERIEKELRVAMNLKEPAAASGNCRNQKCA